MVRKARRRWDDRSGIEVIKSDIRMEGLCPVANLGKKFGFWCDL